MSPPSSDNKSEYLLFLQFKKGSEKVFTHYFNSYFRAVAGFCEQFIDDKETARGIAQEAFVNLWLNKDKIEKPGGIPSFLYTSARSKCLNELKHLKVVRKYHNETLAKKEHALNLEVLEGMERDSLSFQELENTINQFIEELPLQTRTIFKMKRFENKKNSEIADELNISVKTVEAHMTKALNILRKSLSDYLPATIVALIPHLS